MWGYILDSFPGAIGYAVMFGTLGTVALVGAWVEHRLHSRIIGGTAARIGARLKALDASLGLGGEEKTLSALVDREKPIDK